MVLEAKFTSRVSGNPGKRQLICVVSFLILSSFKFAYCVSNCYLFCIWICCIVCLKCHVFTVLMKHKLVKLVRKTWFCASFCHITNQSSFKGLLFLQENGEIISTAKDFPKSQIPGVGLKEKVPFSFLALLK